jgi:hypothetical protein
LDGIATWEPGLELERKIRYFSNICGDRCLVTIHIFILLRTITTQVSCYKTVLPAARYTVTLIIISRKTFGTLTGRFVGGYGANTFVFAGVGTAGIRCSD